MAFLALEINASVRLCVSAQPLEEEFRFHPRSLAEQSPKRDDSSQRRRRCAVSINVQCGEARDVSLAIGNNRQPEINVQSLEVAAVRVRRRDDEMPHHGKARHPRANGVLPSGLLEDALRARPRELLAVVWDAEMHEPDVQELARGRRWIGLD